MNPEKLKAAIEAIKNNDGDAALALLEEMLTGTGGEPAPAEGEPTDALPEPAAAPAPDPNAPAASAAEDAPATAMLLRITGAKSLAEAEPILRTAVTSAQTNETTRRALDMTARRELIVTLIELGAETPATAWDGKPEDRKPKSRLMSEPLEEMRARITSLKARGGSSPGAHQPPEGSPVDVAKAVSELSQDTLAAIKKKGLTPEQFVAERAKATRRAS